MDVAEMRSEVHPVKMTPLDFVELRLRKPSTCKKCRIYEAQRQNCAQK